MTTTQEQKPFLAILTLLGFQINSAIEERSWKQSFF